jgi:hypothetical protein
MDNFPENRWIPLLGSEKVRVLFGRYESVKIRSTVLLDGQNWFFGEIRKPLGMEQAPGR